MPSARSWALRGPALWAKGPCQPAILFPMVILGGSVFDYFRSDVCSLSNEVKHASSLNIFGRCAQACRQTCINHCEYTLHSDWLGYEEIEYKDGMFQPFF